MSKLAILIPSDGAGPDESLASLEQAALDTIIANATIFHRGGTSPLHLGGETARHE